MNPYIGHDSQIGGVEEHRLVGGKGDGMRLYVINNGKGLEMTVTPDRAGDISRLRYKGMNLSYMSAAGYVAPAYYDCVEGGWLKSFTCGFLTTCGLNAVGSPCTDEGVRLPLHGTIGNIPASHAYWTEDESTLRVHTVVKDEEIFSQKLRLTREICISKEENVFVIRDIIENTGDTVQPYEILYHMNMGYPLLDEDSVVTVPSSEVIPRNEHAAEDLANWMKMEKPQAGYEERCYYHKFSDEKGRAAIYQPKLGIELEMTFDAKLLDGFVEWKMMGVRDYVLGLEPGNCYPDGRDVMRKNGMLKFLEPGQKQQYEIRIEIKEKDKTK